MKPRKMRKQFRGHTLCWCGHERSLHWWWDAAIGETCCDGPDCACAIYMPASKVALEEETP